VADHIPYTQTPQYKNTCQHKLLE